MRTQRIAAAVSEESIDTDFLRKKRPEKSKKDATNKFLKRSFF